MLKMQANLLCVSFLPVRETFARDFSNDVHLVVVAQGTGQFLVSHVGPVFLTSPQASQAVRTEDPEHVLALVLPTHETRIFAVLEKLV